MFFVMVLVDVIIIFSFLFIALRKGDIHIKNRMWVYLFISGFLFQIIFLLRKHWEVYLLSLNTSLWYVLTIVQADNAFWEELAKLLAVLVVVYFLDKNMMVQFKDLKYSTAIFTYTGLAYGIGEAMSLMFLFYHPQYGQIFGMQFPVGLTLGFGYVLERFFAILAHGIMGGIIGIGFSRYVFNKKFISLLIYFIIAMFYHMFIDGFVILCQYYLQFYSLFNSMSFLVLSILLGYVLLYFLYKNAIKRERRV
ncbi:hypothetical protein SAMN02745195_00336 [Thermoanaerobacter uzonensis DSM 18761]|uniref:Membrane proteinase PrsW, cleaves anti-sigma factor RsiW, M82 family n=1 Tax=Thermoanaerobacter uzonensis DSM 18761 TaxID=1123369 RepID=A0A1M4TE15_9THEO|nr:hypothetical protein [Thermoanaerobacter uzonensis]SHE42716.1 hypothetical protein SAMN02745195_00336 [Thermoanaerobacter uzonensis DSM 18761]